MRTARLVDAVLGCYPSWWRRRYGREVQRLAADLLAEGRSAIGVAADLARGALRAWARAEGMPPAARLWSARTRLALAAAAVPAALAVPLLMVGVSVDPVYRTAAAAGALFGTPPWLQVPGPHGFLAAPPLTLAGSVAVHTDHVLSWLAIALLFTLLVGWSLLLGAVRRAPRHRRHGATRWALVPGLSLAADVGLYLVRETVQPAWAKHGPRPPVPLGGDPAAAHALGMALGAVALAGWLVSVAAVVMAARCSWVDPTELRRGRAVVVVLAGVVALLAAAFLVRGVALAVQASAGPGFTTVAFVHQGAWVPLAAAFLAAAMATAACARSAARSWRVLAALLT
ncbi:MAG: hypothetical protein ACRDY3_00215 [Acidimicrobiales bacterium]